MQAAGMLRGTGPATVASVYLLLGTLILTFVGDNAHALPLQVLPNIPGWIPVYIRLGDQPLQDINPALAEAFHEKEMLEKTPSEHLDHDSGNLEKVPVNHPTYDEVGKEDDDLHSGSQREDTFYLIGVRQPNSDESKGKANVAKIALPFKILEGGAADEAKDVQDHATAEDVWLEEPGKSHGRRPIALSKEAVIKVGGLPVDVKDLERLATEVEREKTQPNHLHDSTSLNDRDVSPHELSSNIGKVSVRRSAFETVASSADRGMNSGHDANTDEDDLNKNTRSRSVEDLKEFRSNRSMPSEPLLRPAKDPKESRLNDDSTDFMEGEE